MSDEHISKYGTEEGFEVASWTQDGDDISDHEITAFRGERARVRQEAFYEGLLQARDGVGEAT